MSMTLLINSLYVTLFLYNPEHICLHTVKMIEQFYFTHR